MTGKRVQPSDEVRYRNIFFNFSLPQSHPSHPSRIAVSTIVSEKKRLLGEKGLQRVRVLRNINEYSVELLSEILGYDS